MDQKIVLTFFLGAACGASGMLIAIPSDQALTVQNVKIPPPPDVQTHAPHPVSQPQLQIVRPDALPADQLDIPSEREAALALNNSKDGKWKDLSVKLGQCSKDNLGPGVQCTVVANWQGLQGPIEKTLVVGYSRTPTGWFAAHYY